MAVTENFDIKSVMIVATVWFISSIQAFVSKSMGVLLPVLMEQFAAYTRNLGVVVSLTFFSGNFLALIAQQLTEKFGARIILMYFGIVSCGGLFITCFANNTLIVMVGMFFFGFAYVEETITLGALALYFPRHTDAVSTVVLSSLPIGIMMSAPVTQFLIDTYGWRGAMFIITGLFMNHIPAIALLKPLAEISFDNVGQSKQRLDEDGETISIFIQLETLWREIFLNQSCFFYLTLVASFISGYTLNGWVVYMVSVAQSKGLTSAAAAYVTTISGVGCFAIRIAFAIGTRTFTHHRQLFRFASVLIMLSNGGMACVSSFWLLSLCSLILGVAYGILGSQIYCAAIANVDKADAMNAVAIVNIFLCIGYITSGYVSGWLYDLYGTFTPTLIAQCVVSSLLLKMLVIEYSLKWCTTK